jgi:heterodisulfide reductase subunit A-like polyferredoxin
MTKAVRILYCHCAYARVVPEKVKEEVLQKLSESGVAFDAVADLCEMSARRDPALKRIADAGAVKIAACYPRAVRWLFSAGQAPLPQEGVEVLNMRVESADSVVNSLLGEGSNEEVKS